MEAYIVYQDIYRENNQIDRKKLGTFLTKEEALGRVQKETEGKKPCQPYSGNAFLLGSPTCYHIYQVMEVVSYNGKPEYREVQFYDSDIVREETLRQGLLSFAKQLLIGFALLILAMPILIKLNDLDTKTGIVSIAILSIIVLFFAYLFLSDKFKQKDKHNK